MMNTCLDWNNASDLFRLVQLLQAGKLVVGTSDTVLGLLGIVSKEVFDQLNHIKGRAGKPYIVLIRSFDYLKIYTKDIPSDSVRNMLQTCWPGPLTVILPAKDSLPDYMQSASKTIALRVPDHKGLHVVMDKVGPLFSTSANRAGNPVPNKLSDVNDEIMKEIAGCVDEKRTFISLPSTIVDCTGSKPKIIREGAVSTEVIQSFW